MSSSFARAFRVSTIVGISALALMPGLAVAQDEGSGDENGKEIVVTGTLIRGIAPVGSNTIAIGQSKIEETASLTSNELLATIPQVTNYFNNVPAADLAIAVNQFQVSRPNIRRISPNNASSSGTLILIDGHRIASAGVSQASTDPDVIPTGAIERVDVATEGGSATYGSDAVAGTINFVTRKRFDGLKVDAHYGIADDYWQWDASATAGKDWGSGSLWVSYTYTKNRPLFGGDRDFIHRLNYSAAPVNGVYPGRSAQCAVPNINIATSLPPPLPGGVQSQTTYPYKPGATGATLVAGVPNSCDELTNTAIVPAAERHGVMAGLYQELDDSTTITARAFFSRRSTLGTAPSLGTITMSTSNPFAITPAGARLGPGAVCSPQIPFAICNASETVDFSFSPLLGNASKQQKTLLEEWGANAELTKKLGENWEVRGLFNYSRSNSGFELIDANTTRLNAAGAGTTAATAFNPFNLAQTNPAVIASIMNNEIAGQAKDELLDLRLIADGKLFELPGGDVRMAIGAEYMHDGFSKRYQTDIAIGALSGFPFVNYGRNVKSVFGELNLPIIGGNGPSLVISAAGRYDDYSDFGHTFNPKLGATFKPVDWLSLRGNWGTSFTAPTPLDQLGSLANTINAFPFVAFTKPGDTTAPGSYTIALQGSAPNLQPQKADTWSVGFDADLPFVPGLKTSLSYYRVIFKDILSTPVVNSQIFTNFGSNITTNVAGLSAAQLNAFAALAPNGHAVIDPLIGTRTVYETVDFRTNNYGTLKVGGLDGSVNYATATNFGGVDFALNVNYQLERKSQVTPTAAVVDLLAKDDGPKLFLQASTGINIGGLRAQVTWNHSGGYDITPTASVPVQNHIGAFNVFNLFFKYEVKSDATMFKDLSFTLNVNNVFDQDPPVSFLTGPADNGYANGFTLGRMFVLGVSKKF
ncbi:TonB-dependent receptor [Novosphingobium sp. G106]|uniref:TonB-dependent receptor domain-containing protein n=1 Tax=Novosphingobium sp. G106 TaxID=2849500 RepID=UPI001C2DABEC|nr:TonB-dependent receptor [Novosphingobium sp. G106]MBV1686707.1 TonB-dependent receptor [Novosphingobium sp. G106]